MPIFPREGSLEGSCIDQTVVGITAIRDMGRLLCFISLFNFVSVIKSKFQTCTEVLNSAQ